MEIPLFKWMIWGVPLFLATSISIRNLVRDLIPAGWSPQKVVEQQNLSKTALNSG